MSQASIKLTHYKQASIKLMNAIESMTGMLMSEIDSQLEERYWRAYDNHDINSLRRVHAELAELHDTKMSLDKNATKMLRKLKNKRIIK